MIEFQNQNGVVLMTAFADKERKSPLDEVFDKIDVLSTLSGRFQDIYKSNKNVNSIREHFDADILEAIDNLIAVGDQKFRTAIEKCTIEIAPGINQQLLTINQALAIHTLIEYRWLTPSAVLQVKTPQITNAKKYAPSEIISIKMVEECEEESIPGNLVITNEIIEYASTSIGYEDPSIEGVLCIPLTNVHRASRTPRDYTYLTIKSQIKMFINIVNRQSDGSIGPYIP